MSERRRGVWPFVVLGLFVACGPERDESATTNASPLVASARTALVTTPEISQFAVYASNSVALMDRVVVAGGHVGVKLSAGGPFLVNGYQAALAADSRVDTSRDLLAERVLLKDRATVGDVEATHITNQFGVFAQQYPLPPMPAFPEAAAAIPGSTPRTVPSGQTQTLAAGAYAAVTVNGTLNLGGGTYDFASLMLGNDARLQALASSTVRIAGRLATGDRARIVPSGISLTAKDMRLEVHGQNGASGALNATPRAAVLGNDTVVRALVLVPNGTLQTGHRTNATGALFARDVLVNLDARVTFEDGFSSGTCDSCDDNNPCTTDACSSGSCEHTPVSNGTACNDDNPCTLTDTCQGGTCVGGDPVICAPLDPCRVAGTCDPSTGTCSNPPAPDGQPCDSGDRCVAAFCANGACTGGTPVTCTSPGPCETAVCDPT
ncbi:MAG: hypothetical protein KIT84_28300, partial [Labilithrix sp.]|nr:hypothetical protein [Labilithrix sp.]